MKITLWIIISFISVTIVACKGNYKTQPVPDAKLVNEVILNALTLDADTLVFKTDSSENQLCETIAPYVLHSEKVINTPQPTGSYATMNMKMFLESEHNMIDNENRIFSAEDTAYFLRQIDAYRAYRVDEKQFNEIKLCDCDSVSKHIKPRFKVFLPLFSVDLTEAYIQLDQRYYGGGNSKRIILKKENGKWVLFKKWFTWKI